MSYSFDLLFVKDVMKTEGDALKYANDLVKRIATNHDLAMEQIKAHPFTIANRLRMAGLKWETVEERKAAMKTEAARLAMESAIRIIFSQRIIYWGAKDHLYMMAFVGDGLPESISKDMVRICFQNSCDQDYDYDEWSDEIPVFWHEKRGVRELPAEKLVEGLKWDEPGDLEYMRRSLLYRRIYDKLALDNWLYRAAEEDGFKTHGICGIISQEVEMALTIKLRAHIMSSADFICL